VAIASLFIFRFGFIKDKHLHKTDILQIIVIIALIYIMFTYLFGLITGFTRNPHSFAFLRIIQNTVPVIIIILLQEITRYISITKGNRLNIIIMTLFLILMPIILGIRFYELNTGMGVFEAIGLLILPNILNNLLLTYIVIKVGFKPAIIYRLVLALPIFLIPIIPDLGPYLDSIFQLLFVTIVFLRVNSFFMKVEMGTYRKGRIKRKATIIPLLFVMIVMIALTSGVFRYNMIAVGSNSMYPNIRRGDAIIIRNLRSEEIYELQIGDILAYRIDGQLTIHRLIDVIEVNNVLFFQTKGDNNPMADDYYLRSYQIEGVVLFRIPYLGFPSILLSR